MPHDIVKSIQQLADVLMGVITAEVEEETEGSAKTAAISG